METPIGFPKGARLHVQGNFFEVQDLLLETMNLFTVNHESGTLFYPDRTSFDSNQKGFYKISTESLLGRAIFEGYVLYPTAESTKGSAKLLFFESTRSGFMWIKKFLFKSFIFIISDER